MTKIPRLLPLVAVAIGGVVTLRLVGVAPELFSGAKAWAEEATTAAPTPAASAARPPAVCALTPEQLARQAGISPAELRVIQSLSKRRDELDARDQDLASMLPLLAAAEQKLDAKIGALNTVKGEVQAMLGQVDERRKAEVDRLVAVYSAMRPREAARVFSTLDDDVRLPVAAAMRPRSLAAIMAQMDPAAARVLTEKLARRFEAQQLAARAAAAAQTSNAPAPAQTAAQTPAQTQPTPTPASNAGQAQPTPQPALRPASAPARTPQRAAARPANRPAPQRATPQRTPARTATPEPSGPRPYQAAAPGAANASATPASPRQSVQ